MRRCRPNPLRPPVVSVQPSGILVVHLLCGQGSVSVFGEVITAVRMANNIACGTAATIRQGHIDLPAEITKAGETPHCGHVDNRNLVLRSMHLPLNRATMPSAIRKGMDMIERFGPALLAV